MASSSKNDRQIAEFGDFQTPDILAVQACKVLNQLKIAPASIVEPTCGTGSFLAAAVAMFPTAKRVLGLDINSSYISIANAKLAAQKHPEIELRCASFFSTPWEQLFLQLPGPVLVVGNPPWVTNSHLGVLGSDNLPEKSNFQNHKGFDAITGKSNFDISEWMLIHLLECLQGRNAVLGMLCKTAVARKTLHHAWKNGIQLQSASIYLIDAAKHFNAAVDACFFICHTSQQKNGIHECSVYPNLTEEQESVQIFGYRDSQLVARVQSYDRWKHLQGTEHYKWRSGIKHDCSKIMELRRLGPRYVNGLGEVVDLERRYLFPMLKSSDIANGKVHATDRWMVVPQTWTGEETDSIARYAPLTWEYLVRHGNLLDDRGSSIYKKRPRFSVFGIGPYSFSRWKVAISGFYKSLNFRVVGSIEGVPTVLDDTSNFLSCETEDEATLLAEMLNSSTAAEFFNAFIFWDAKRPLTIDLLRRLDLAKLAQTCGKWRGFDTYLRVKSSMISHGRKKRDEAPGLFSAI